MAGDPVETSPSPYMGREDTGSSDSSLLGWNDDDKKDRSERPCRSEAALRLLERLHAEQEAPASPVSPEASTKAPISPSQVEEVQPLVKPAGNQWCSIM